MDNLIYLQITENVSVTVGNATTYVYGGINMENIVYGFIDERTNIGYAIYKGASEALAGTTAVEIAKETFDTISNDYLAYENNKASMSLPEPMLRLEELEKENKVLRESNTNLHKTQTDQDELLMQLMLSTGGN
ncbi:hypothetical protein ACQQ6W_06040 [Lysinibacillus fusiformis]